MRFTRFAFLRRKWLLPILVRINFPDPVYLNRLDVALWVFILGIYLPSPLNVGPGTYLFGDKIINIVRPSIAGLCSTTEISSSSASICSISLRATSG